MKKTARLKWFMWKWLFLQLISGKNLNFFCTVLPNNHLITRGYKKGTKYQSFKIGILAYGHEWQSAYGQKAMPGCKISAHQENYSENNQNKTNFSNITLQFDLDSKMTNSGWNFILWLNKIHIWSSYFNNGLDLYMPFK